MKKVLGIPLILLMLLVFSACACKHEWSEATCSEPMICAKCGETEGLPLGHQWEPATCTEAKACRVCGETEGEPAGHQWEPATCTEAKTCRVCGETEGDAKGHDWVAASCEKPKTCKICGMVEGEALGHIWEDATCISPQTCTRCKKTVGEPLGHQISEWSVVKEASCTEYGIESGCCEVCGEQLSRDTELKEHMPSDWIVDTPADIDSSGVKIIKCTICGEELDRDVYYLTEEESKQLYISRCQSISYKDLARSPQAYEGTSVKMSGVVVQIVSEASSKLYYSTYRVATLNGYDNIVYIFVDNYGSGSRILEDDWITFYGDFDGLYTYTTIFGASITIPSVKVKYLG